MKHKKHTFCEYTPETWADTRKQMYSLSSCIFRRQENSAWKLSGGNNFDIPKIEEKVLKLFKRRTPQYTSNLPSENTLGSL